MPGVIDALRGLQSIGYLLIIITNQSGIARGYYTLDDFYKINAWMIQELEKHCVRIDAVYFCPHHPEGVIPEFQVNCDCRKPKLGLYKHAVRDFDLDLSKCFAIGDKIRDCAICRASSCRGFLISKNEKTEIIEEAKNGDYINLSYASNLHEAAKKILMLNLK